VTKLKIASWNINSVRARVPIVERFLDEEQPDILCLQETKAMDNVFPADLFHSRGYIHHELNGQKMHHGVAILSRVRLHDSGRHDWQDNGEARHVGARLDCGIRLENVYIPAGGDIPDRTLNPKFGQKLDFIERMTRWSEKLAEPTLIVGDFNIAPLECDVWNHKALLDVVSHTPIEVETLERLRQAHDWVDLGRKFIPRRNAASPGGAIARRIGRRAIAAAGSTICGLAEPCAAGTAHRVLEPAAAGNGRRTMCR
jgi:exodeoxyribonuclease-3